MREKSLYYTNSKQYPFQSVNFVFFFSWKEFSVIFLMKKKKVFWQSVFYHHHHRHFLGNWMNLVFIFAYTWEDTVQHIQKKWYYNRAQQKKKMVLILIYHPKIIWFIHCKTYIILLVYFRSINTFYKKGRVKGTA